MPPFLNQRFIDASCLQKSIRRNLPQYALPAAQRLFTNAPSYLIRRLGTIALEDIGMANLPLVMRYMAEAVQVVDRTDATTRAWVMRQVETLCASSKSRYLTEISFTTHFHPAFQRFTTEMQLLGEAKALDLLTLEKDPLAAQCIARTLPPATLATLVPPEVATLFQNARTLKTEGLHWALVPALREQPLPAVTHSLPAPTLIGGLPSYTYDKHTRSGSLALRRFLKLHMPELHKLETERAWFAMYLLLFEAETGRLDVEVPFPKQPRVKFRFWETTKLDPVWLEALVPVVKARLPLLDECRARVVKDDFTGDNTHLSPTKKGA